MKYEEAPNYEYIYKLLDEVKANLYLSSEFDWEISGKVNYKSSTMECNAKKTKKYRRGSISNSVNPFENLKKKTKKSKKTGSSSNKKHLKKAVKYEDSAPWVFDIKKYLECQETVKISPLELLHKHLICNDEIINCGETAENKEACSIH